MSTPKKTTSITLDMNIGDAAFLKIAKAAHANNRTFNDQINRIVADAVANLDRPAVAVPTTQPFGFSAKPQGF
jgi:hypothetical protein